jgi:hypothetical protein
MAQIEASSVVRRVYDIAVSQGRETWSRQVEKTLRERLNNASLRLTFQRPRSIAVERAIHQAAAELVDAGSLKVRDAHDLLACLRTCDPALLRLAPEHTPAAFAPFSPPEAYGGQEQSWAAECVDQNDSIKQLIARHLDGRCVIAEHSVFRSGRQGCREERWSNLWVDAAQPEDLQQPLPRDAVSYASRYFRVAMAEGSLALRHTAFMEHHGSHCEWITLNSNAGEALGLQPDASRPFGWTDGEDSMWVLRWIDGHPLVNPSEGHQSDGWMLLATNGLASKMNDLFSDIRRFCVVRRTSREQESISQWDESFLS